MDYKERYLKWLREDFFDEATKRELKSIAHNEKEIEDRFYKDLAFGTGGLRGIIGAGTNRMNKYTVARATQGLANYFICQGQDARKKGVVIAYDSRHQSPEFAEEAALVLCANDIKTYLFTSLRATPELSFAVRELGCAAGIVITASHNPPEYNGYKVYGEDGGQIVPQQAEKIMAEIDKIQDYKWVQTMSREKALSMGLLVWIGEEIDQKYIDCIKTLVLRKEMVHSMGKDIRILYTPLHGTGGMVVPRALRETGFTQVYVVPEQEEPHPDFPTVSSPNPEEKEAFAMALKMAESIIPDVILGTDPDCDRVGVVVKDDQNTYQTLTGNQIGALLVHYRLSTMKEQGNLPEKGVVIKTIVTGEMGAKIARSFGIDTLDTLTGFKFIGEKIKELEETKEKQFLFGYEESYGYLAGTFVRDKDGVMASVLICEMALYYKAQGMTLLDALQELYGKYGCYQESLQAVPLKGREGLEKIQAILTYFREHPPLRVAGVKLRRQRDYQTGKGYDFLTGEKEVLSLPSSDTLHFTLEDDSWFCIRPSGTEPKLKLYFSVVGKSPKDAEKKLKRLEREIMDLIHRRFL